jgi:hypothetical protein
MEYSERYRAAGDAEAVSVSAAAEETLHSRIARTLEQWVAQHPSPEMPALSLAEMGEFSPRQIFEAVKAKTDVGEFVEVLIVNGVRMHPEGIEGVLKTFAASEPEREAESRPVMTRW